MNGLTVPVRKGTVASRELIPVDLAQVLCKAARGIDLTPFGIAIRSVGFAPSAVDVITRLENLAGNMHLPFKNQRAVKVIMGMSRLHVTRRKLDELVHP